MRPTASTAPDSPPSRMPTAGAAELVEISNMGFKAVMMSGMPGTADYDDPAYDRLWATAVELGLPLCFHILTNTSYSGHRGPKINALLNVIRSCQDIIGMLIYSGVFDRFPALKVVCVEADAGWAPHYAYRMDHIYNRHRFWNKAPALTKLPSEYFFDNVYMTFQDDWTALHMTDQLNVERLLWANDFPHSDSTWPLSQELVNKHMAHLTRTAVPPHPARQLCRAVRHGGARAGRRHRPGQLASRASRMSYDLKIVNGTVIDGSGAEGVRGDVGIVDGRIVALGAAPDAAAQTIDATRAHRLPRLYRHPHPLRRPDHLGSQPQHLALARRHDSRGR